MRILLISPEYPPYNIGGGGVAVRNIAQTFSKKGYEVIVVSGYYLAKSFLQKVSVSRDYKIKIFWLPLLPTPPVSFQLKTIMPPNIYSIAFLFMLILKNRFEIINIHGYGHILNDFAVLTSKLFNRKYVATIHGIPRQPERQSGLLNVIFRVYSKTFGKLFLSWASVITAVSEHTAEHIMSYGADPKKVIVVPNGVDAETFANPLIPVLEEVKRRYALEGKKLILSVGRLSEAKGFQFLLYAMPRIIRKVPNSYLMIAGADGGYRNELARIINELNLRNHVKLAGEIGEEIKKALYSLADVVVIPSIVEPFGMVALEAMSAGKPIVASDTEGLSEILKDKGIGRTVKVGNSKEIAEQVAEILTNLQWEKETARLLLKEAALYSWESIGDLYFEAYSRVR